MKMNQLKYVVVASLFALGLVNQSLAVDVAAASGVMADLEGLVVAAKENLANAALSGDVDAIAEANKRSDAIDAAVAAGREALSAMEQADANGDADVAESAEDDLAAALRQAKDALSGALPEVADSQVAGKKNNGNGGPGKPGDPPNIYDVPWKSQGIRAYYQSLFGAFHDASSFGHGKGFGDRDATPE